LARVAELLTGIVTQNGIQTEDVAAVIFSSTADINAAFPAKVPLFGTQEIEAVDAVDKCVRVLLLWNTDKTQKEIRHLYLQGAAVLRRDLAPGR